MEKAELEIQQGCDRQANLDVLDQMWGLFWLLFVSHKNWWFFHNPVVCSDVQSAKELWPMSTLKRDSPLRLCICPLQMLSTFWRDQSPYAFIEKQTPSKSNLSSKSGFGRFCAGSPQKREWKHILKHVLIASALKPWPVPKLLRFQTSFYN